VFCNCFRRWIEDHPKALFAVLGVQSRSFIAGFLSDRAARHDLTPAHRQIAVEGEQARRGTTLDDLSQRLFVFAALPAIGAADAPIHAPAAIAGTPLANRSSSAGHRSGVSGRIASFMPLSFFVIPGRTVLSIWHLGLSTKYPLPTNWTNDLPGPLCPAIASVPGGCRQRREGTSSETLP